jgi:small subunit ribosomal protein S16
MAAKIRLKKVGRKGQPSFRVVVLDGHKPRDTKVVADLGHYDPKTHPATFEIDQEAALKWLLDGAKATKAARDILSKAGVMAAWDAARRGKDVVFEPRVEAKEESPPRKKRGKKSAAEPPVATEATGELEEPTDQEPPAAAEPEEIAADEAPVEETAEADELATDEAPVKETAEADELATDEASVKETAEADEVATDEASVEETTEAEAAPEEEAGEEEGEAEEDKATTES